MESRGDPRQWPWVHLLLWILLILDLAAAWVLPPWLDDDTRRRIAATGTIRVGLDPAYPPFENELQGHLAGYDVDLARELVRLLDLEITFVPMAYDALHDALVSGQIDVILSSYPYSPELCRRERCTAAYFQAGQVLVVRADSSIAGPDDLAGQSVGVEWGGAGDSLARQWEQAGGIGARMPLMSPQEAMLALLAGEVDAVIVDRVSALLFVGSQEGLVVLEPPLLDEDFVAVVAQRSVWLHGRLQWALGRMAQDGTLDLLESRWIEEIVP